MSTIIKPVVIEELKQVFSEIFFSRTDKVTKITEGSVLNAIAFGNSKLAQKAIKDIALAQSHFYPDTAYGQYLDNIANMYGIASRFGAIGSSTYVRLVGQTGTVYTNGAHTFSGDSGIVFDLNETVVIGDSGYAYALVSSQSVGVDTNVDPFDINEIDTAPAGHEFVTNEYAAFGGRDAEDDDAFRDRIKNAINELARGTIAMVEQVFMKINPKVLRVFNYGTNANGQVILAVLTQNGGALLQAEIDELVDESKQYFTFTEINPNGFTSSGVEIKNAEWFPVDISCRVRLNPLYNQNEVRRQIQLRLNKYFDYRNWVSGTKVEWDDLLEIVKNTEGVEYTFDNYFFPNYDVPVDFPLIPRVRGFLLLDEDGTLLSDGTQNLNPVFYPQQLDFKYQANVLSNI